ncbi:hypothetical protein [Burkholderia territorii]|uniref:hypothetical protein n=1 Tax=Burkholderia territorii TaxID=1503055 RepID=UPI000AD68D99|nr:hypothetical protein [Burkholderia territorii]
MKAGARNRLADVSPGFCLKNIGTKLLQKFRCAWRPACRIACAVPAGTRRLK